jgi:cell division protein FtsQ
MDRRGGIVTITTEDHTTESGPRVRTPIDPRIRERRIEVIREAGRRRLRVTLIVASTIVALGVAYLAVHSPLLDLDHIRVTGARRERTADIVAATGVHTGAALLFVDTGRIERRLEQLPWVAHATVERDLPGTIRIHVTEYMPTVFVRVAANRVALVASTGRVVAFAKAPTPGAIEVAGERVAPTIGSLISPPEVARAVRVLPARLRAMVATIDVKRATITLRTGGPEIRLGSLTDMRAKGLSALAVLDNLAGQTCTYVDVAAPQAPSSLCNH